MGFGLLGNKHMKKFHIQMKFTEIIEERNHLSENNINEIINSILEKEQQTER